MHTERNFEVVGFIVENGNAKTTENILLCDFMNYIMFCSVLCLQIYCTIHFRFLFVAVSSMSTTMFVLFVFLCVTHFFCNLKNDILTNLPVVEYGSLAYERSPVDVYPVS